MSIPGGLRVISVLPAHDVNCPQARRQIGPTTPVRSIVDEHFALEVLPHPEYPVPAPESAMRPDELATHRANRARRDKRGLATSLRHAYLAADTDERITLAAIVRDVEREAITVDDARQRVAAIRRVQSHRTQRAA